ncbi:MAG TPA: hypothetical protein VKW06_20515 [Candidatus Angelobacter sp.]|nr:hypothetical protein [Candidatus Angelobacter sp.]
MLLQDRRWHRWKREFGPGCEGFVGLLGILACAVGVVLGLEFFKYFFTLALAGGAVTAAISYLARR